MYVNGAFKDAKIDGFYFLLFLFHLRLLNRIVRNIHTKSYQSKATFEPNLSVLLAGIKDGNVSGSSCVVVSE
jgi:hypothetical protein